MLESAGEKVRKKAKEKVAVAKLRLRQLKEHNKEKGREILKGYAKEKLKKAKEDRRFAAIYILEFALIAVILVSIAVFLDEDAKAALAKFLAKGETFLPAPYSYIAFIVVIAVVFLLYSYTSGFRKAG